MVKHNPLPVLAFAMSAAITLGTACSNPPVSGSERPQGLVASTPDSIDWQVGNFIGGVADDSTLQLALRPIANRRGLFFADLGSKQVTHVDHSGRIVWRFGKAGAGPGEFMEPRDLRLDADGRVWVLDVKNARISILSPDGVLVDDIPLGGLTSRPSEFVPLKGGQALLVLGDPLAPFVVIDSAGDPIAKMQFPWPPFAEMSALSTQLVTAVQPASDTWVTAFRLGDGFFMFDGSKWTGMRGWFAEFVEFPEAVEKQSGDMTVTSFKGRPVSAARSLTLSGSRLYVLFGGASENRRRLVHQYRLSDGAYERSFLLPEPALEIAWYDGGLYVLRENPYPEIVFLRPKTSLP